MAYCLAGARVDLELLQSISYAVSQARSVDTVLSMIVAGLVDKAGIGLARIWLRGPGDLCADCRMRPECPSRRECLHLRASAGRSRIDGRTWDRLDGEFRRIPLGMRKIGRSAATGESFLLRHELRDPAWMVHPDWAPREGVQSIAAHPLLFRGANLGVLGVFSRQVISPQQFGWLRVFADQAAVSIANARAFEELEALRQRLELENEYLRSEVTERFGGLLGESPPFRQILQQVELVAPTDASVLILGESGTGKELIARAIHARSNRRGQALVKVNCASVPRDLFESEFFGHVKGSFTGALRDRQGRFHLADGGTLFLDEIGEIPLELQGKLLRVLQEGEFERVGDDRTRRVNVRIIAATNRDLEQEVQAGRFRQDLYFRLSVFPLEVPPLRERREDIPILAAHFMERAAARLHLPARPITRAQATELLRYAWPGNVRELENVIERALIVSQGQPLRFDLRAHPPKASGNGRPVSTRAELLEIDRQRIEDALRLSQGRIYGRGGAAELLGLRPTTLSSKIDALGIVRPPGRARTNDR